jgi:NodT family efflux transporter outer membrane factor (OMF) lipoprotein
MSRTVQGLFIGALLGAAAALCGCAPAAATWERPAVRIPPDWSGATAAGVENPQAWWRNFRDPQLDALVERALASNNDFAVAVIRVHRAQLQAGLTDTNRRPVLVAGAGTSLTRTLDPASNLRSSGVNASLSYEADLWGKLARQRDAGHWEATAAESDCRAFAAALAGTTAKLYWQLAYLNQLLSMADADIDYAQRTLALTRNKYEAGATSGLNTAEAELNLSTLQSVRTQQLEQRAETRNALAILFDQPPGTNGTERPALADGPLPAIGAGLPADILANRPDLQAAEQRLREAMATVDATRASFFPVLSLTGSLGTASDGLIALLRNPFGTLGAGLLLPFVQIPTARLSNRISQSQYEEAVVAFRQRLYTALAEVENALSVRSSLQQDERTQQGAVAQAHLAESIARVRFESGASDVQLWLDAQQRARGVERSLLANRLSQFENQANLYQALGLGIARDRVNCGSS